jgi:hypothetical protein
MLQTRITVPFSEAEARRVPVELIDKKEMGALCACMTLATVRDRVEKRRTSPDWASGVVEADEGGLDTAVEVEDVCATRGDVGDGTGDGYARYDASADGDRAHMAGGVTGVWPVFAKGRYGHVPDGLNVVSMTCSNRIFDMSYM